MSIQNIVQEYLEIENKDIRNLEPLAKKYGLTTRELISLLNRYNIETPKILRRIEAIDWESITNLKEKYIRKQVSNKMDLDDNDISIAVSIQKYFHDLGFDDKKGSEKAKALCNYVKTQFGIDVFDVLVLVLVNLIKNEGVLTLENVLEDIKHRDSNISETTMDNKRNSITNQIKAKMLGMTRDIMLAPEIERKEKIKEGVQTINKAIEKEHRKKVKVGLKIIKSVLGKQDTILEPKQKVVDKPKPKPKIKRDFSSDEVGKYLESLSK